MRHEFAVEAMMADFHHVGAKHASGQRDVEARLRVNTSILMIGGLSVLSWGVLVGVVMALRAVL